MVKLPMSYQIDFVVLRDGVIKSVLEVKQRDINLTTYPTIILSIHPHDISVRESSPNNVTRSYCLYFPSPSP